MPPGSHETGSRYQTSGTADTWMQYGAKEGFGAKKDAHGPDFADACNQGQSIGGMDDRFSDDNRDVKVMKNHAKSRNDSKFRTDRHEKRTSAIHEALNINLLEDLYESDSKMYSNPNGVLGSIPGIGRFDQERVDFRSINLEDTVRYLFRGLPLLDVRSREKLYEEDRWNTELVFETQDCVQAAIK
jgi:hypothetical protein